MSIDKIRKNRNAAYSNLKDAANYLVQGDIVNALHLTKLALKQMNQIKKLKKKKGNRI